MSVFLSFIALSAELEESLLREDIQSMTCTLLDFCKESADDFSISERRGLSDCDNCEPKEEFIQRLLRALLLVQLRQNSCDQKLNLADEDSGMNFNFCFPRLIHILTLFSLSIKGLLACVLDALRICFRERKGLSPALCVEGLEVIMEYLSHRSEICVQLTLRVLTNGLYNDFNATENFLDLDGLNRILFMLKPRETSSHVRHLGSRLLYMISTSRCKLGLILTRNCHNLTRIFTPGNNQKNCHLFSMRLHGLALNVITFLLSVQCIDGS
jgi:Guanine nucleotide exchange factor synembryn